MPHADKPYCAKKKDFGSGENMVVRSVLNLCAVRSQWNCILCAIILASSDLVGAQVCLICDATARESFGGCSDLVVSL